MNIRQLGYKNNTWRVFNSSGEVCQPNAAILRIQCLQQPYISYYSAVGRENGVVSGDRLVSDATAV